MSHLVTFFDHVLTGKVNPDQLLSTGKVNPRPFNTTQWRIQAESCSYAMFFAGHVDCAERGLAFPVESSCSGLTFPVES